MCQGGGMRGNEPAPSPGEKKGGVKAKRRLECGEEASRARVPSPGWEPTHCPARGCPSRASAPSFSPLPQAKGGFLLFQHTANNTEQSGPTGQYRASGCLLRGAAQATSPHSPQVRALLQLVLQWAPPPRSQATRSPGTVVSKLPPLGAVVGETCIHTSPGQRPP